MLFRARTIYVISLAVLMGMLIHPLAQADTLLVAQDNASNYTNWSGSEGIGMDTWVFRTDGGGGAFLADGKEDLNGIATSNKAWGTWANGSGAQYVAAFRGFGWSGSSWDNRLEKTGDQLKISFEHGAINLNASCGFAIRNGNADGTAHDFNTNDRFQFGLYSGASSVDENYSIYDNNGKVDTGVPSRTSGIDLILTLTATNTYTLGIYDATNSALLTNIVSTLAGSGSIDSLSLFNRETEQDDVFFNKIEIRHFRPPTMLIVK